MRNIVLFTAIAMVAAFAGVASLTYTYSKQIYAYSVRPKVGFSQTPAPAAPDYRQPGAWVALPWLADAADTAPGGERDRQEDAPADVFYVHPNSYATSKRWNAPLDDERANAFLDRRILSNQASIFTLCCRVYAPRYRQATLYAFLSDDADADRAKELAYQDVREAFAHYLQHFGGGRPLILVGHSQGAYHVLRLLEDFFADRRSSANLVVAYVAGWPVPLDKFDRTLADLPLCRDARQVRCVATWNTVGPEIDEARFFEGTRVHYPSGYESNRVKDIACINPLTWRNDALPGAATLHLGAVVFGPMAARSSEEAPLAERGLLDARCEGGLLRIRHLDRPRYQELMVGRDDYHAYDYNLFYMNLRHNAVDRVVAHMIKR